MSSYLWYNSVVPNQFEKKSVNLPMKVQESMLEQIQQIAVAEDRPVGYVARELMTRGLNLYRLDGRLKEDAKPPQDIGTVDEFDPGEALDRLGDPHVIMNDWFRFEGRSMPQDFGVVFFQGWDSFTREERIDAIRDAKKVLDRSAPKPPGEVKRFPLPKDAPRRREAQDLIDSVELQAVEPPRKRKAK